MLLTKLLAVVILEIMNGNSGISFPSLGFGISPSLLSFEDVFPRNIKHFHHKELDVVNHLRLHSSSKLGRDATGYIKVCTQ